MTNPSHSKLSSQFGDITGPSDAELAEIESGSSSASEAGKFYTPEMIEQIRADFAHLDPNYAAVRRSRGQSGGGPGGFGVDFGDRTVHRSTGNSREDMNFTGLSDLAGATEQTRSEGAQYGADISVDMGSSGDEVAPSRKIGGVGMGGWEMEAGKRASSFDRNKPRTQDEAAAREQGKFFLQVAGPTCNHPICQSYRAKGMELIGRGLGSDRLALTDETWHEATPERPPFPSVRKDVPMPTSRLVQRADRPTIDKKTGKEIPAHPVMSYGSGESTDMGDFEFDYKNTVQTPKYSLVHTNDPEYKKMMLEYTAGVRRGDAPLFHPDDYMEHHHEPHEEFAKLPWE